MAGASNSCYTSHSRRYSSRSVGSVHVARQVAKARSQALAGAVVTVVEVVVASVVSVAAVVRVVRVAGAVSS